MRLRMTSGCVAALMGGTPAPVTDASVTAIDAAGWSCQYTSPPTFDPVNSPKYVVLSRPGYDATGSTTTYTDNLIITQRVRQAYPSENSFSANTCALTDWVYSTDTCSGVTNNAASLSPKPICNWATPARRTVGNTIGAGTPFDIEVVAFHMNARGGKQVACCVFTISDGSTTITVTVATPTISPRPDPNPIIVYALPSTNISTLAEDSLITINAKVYPWIGQSGSIADSSTTSVVSGSLLRAFSPRYFYKNAALLAAPWYAVVASAGNDTSGVASQTLATAQATPCLTVKAAMNKINTAGGKVDGAIIYIRDSVSLGSTFFGNFTQKAGAPLITREPGVARATAVCKLDTGFNPPIVTGFLGAVNVGAVCFYDCSILRSGTTQLAGTINYYFDQTNFDNASGNAAWMNATCNDYHYNNTFSNVAVGAGVASSTGEHRVYRGCTATMGGNNGEGWFDIGNTWTTPGTMDQFGSGSTPPTRTMSGAIAAYSKYLQTSSTKGVYDFGANEDVTNFACVQNLFEFTTTGAQFAARFSGDSTALGNMTHLVMHHNTFTGWWTSGRANMLYDTTSGHLRTPKQLSFVGNIHVQLNNKSDLFMTDGQYVGNWGYYYGCGCRAEFTMYNDANTAGLVGNYMSFSQAYLGLKSSLGSSQTVRNDPLFTSYQGTTNSGTSAVAGAGGGTYTLQGGSPCAGQVVVPVLNYDLAGTARPSSNDAMGAYAA
jgi:hypothetical protein